MGDIRVGESLGLEINDTLWVDLWFEVECHVSGRPGSAAENDPVTSEPYDYVCTELVIFNKDTSEEVLTLRGKMADDTWFYWAKTWEFARNRVQDMLECAERTAVERYEQEYAETQERRREVRWG